MNYPITGKKRRYAFATNYKSVPAVVYLWEQNENPRELSLSLLPSKANSQGFDESFYLLYGCLIGIIFV